MHHRARRCAIAAVAAACLVPALAGCWQGQGATTTWQASQNSGNGVEARIGDLSVQNATVVHGEDGRGSLIVSVFNLGPEADTLTGATVNGIAAPLPASPDSTTIKANGSQTFGYGTDGQPAANYLLVQGLDAEPSSYVPVTLTFQRAGQLNISVLTVPPVGYYEGLLPAPGA